MQVGAETIGMVKKNKKGLCKYVIENPTNDLPVDYYLILKRNPMVPKDMPLIAIVYKYNSYKVRSFVATEDKGSTKYGITCLSN